MKAWQELINSGILELYVFGETTEAESKLIEEMAAVHTELAQEIEEISITLEKYAIANAISPDPIVKPFLMAIIDYSDRMKAGEVYSVPPLLNEDSVPDDYLQWLSRSDMAMPHEFEEVFAKIISYSETVITAIVWISNMAPQEVHDHEYEKFLILEGTCDIHIADETHHLQAGDFLTIPLHKQHHVKVTSLIPCKVILQRVAA